MKYRSQEPELMDDLTLSEDKLKVALADVSRVNRLLGGNGITIRAVVNMIRQHPDRDVYTIADVGCGDGTLMREMASTLRQLGVRFLMIGIDINPKSIEIGRSYSEQYPEIAYLERDILTLTKADLPCDIITSTLTMHHFSDEEIVRFVQQFYHLSELGVIINDLHRSRLAYLLFHIYSVFFVRSSIAKHDGLISIQRAFIRTELESYTRRMALDEYHILWKWAFRYLWVIPKNKSPH